MINLILILVLLLFAIWNAYIILWGTENIPYKRKRYSKIWHFYGLLIRAIVTAFLTINAYLYMDGLKSSLKWLLLAVSANILYDFIINLIRWVINGHPSLWYIDRKGWNAFFLYFMNNTWFWIFKLIILIVTILFYIIY